MTFHTGTKLHETTEPFKTIQENGDKSGAESNKRVQYPRHSTTYNIFPTTLLLGRICMLFCDANPVRHSTGTAVYCPAPVKSQKSQVQRTSLATLRRKTSGPKQYREYSFVIGWEKLLYLFWLVYNTTPTCVVRLWLVNIIISQQFHWFILIGQDIFLECFSLACYRQSVEIERFHWSESTKFGSWENLFKKSQRPLKFFWLAQNYLCNR